MEIEFGGMQVSDAKRFKALDDENRPLKKRLAVCWAINDKDYSQCRACRLIGLAPKGYRHHTRRNNDGALREHIRLMALTRWRFGYWRLYLRSLRRGRCCAGNWKRMSAGQQKGFMESFNARFRGECLYAYTERVTRRSSADQNHDGFYL